MNTKDISIATISWVRNAEEDSLLRRSLEQLAGLKIPVFICDGGSANQFVDFLNGFPHFTVVPREAPGVWSQVKSSVHAAYAASSRYILYTEPDKLDFFRQGLLHFFEGANEDQQPGVLMAARSKEAFGTFPAFQQTTETAINNCCSEVIGKALDYTYGPFLFHRELVPYLELVHKDIGWGWRPYVFGIAKRLGYPVNEFTGNFACPEDQRQDDPAERIYRMKQLSQSIDGIVLSATVDI